MCDWPSNKWWWIKKPPDPNCKKCLGRGWTEYIAEYIDEWARYESENCLCTLNEPDVWIKDTAGRWI
ncbi:MAG TPA: hypothetical protein VMX17_12000 [Candidatus Glassbacteria bacterium]|nr:hypothetical protein [Candidatus Glassbacteria bacterium]